MVRVNRLNELIDAKKDFGFETTLTTLAYKQLIKRARQNGFKIRLLFLWLSNPDIAKERVKKRVSEGGHNMPEEVIVRRFHKGIKNLTSFLEIADEWLLLDNSAGKYEWVAKKEKNKTEIFNFEVWEQINP